jgi:endonuclease III
LRERYKSVFQQLVACIISIRTRDEVSLPTAIRLFEHAATPAAVAKLSVSQIDTLIRASSFHEAKAAQIREIARRTVDARSAWAQIFAAIHPAVPRISVSMRIMPPMKMPCVARERPFREVYRMLNR